MGVAADDYVRPDACKYGQEAIFRGIAAKNFRVVARSGVAEQDRAQTLNVELESAWPCGEKLLVFGGKLLRRPVNHAAKFFGNAAAFDAAHSGKHLAVAIAMDELHGCLESQQALHGFPRHGAGEYISTHKDSVRLYTANVLENSLERRQVGMNVIDSGDWHLRHPFRLIERFEPRLQNFCLA